MDIVEAIRRIDPSVSATVKNNEYDTIEWLKGDPIPKDQIDAEIVKLKAEYDAKQYQRDRQYPSIQDQLDMQYWDSVNGTTTWKDAIAKVKTDIPKPE